MLTVPSPTGKIQPYPGSGLPCRSFTSRADSIHGSACFGDSQYVRIAVPYGHSRVRKVPRARPNRLFAPSATTTYFAVSSSVLGAPLRCTTAPRTNPRSITGPSASVFCRIVAPAASALRATIQSRSRRRTTYPYGG